MFLSRPEPVTIAVCDAVHLDPVTKRKTLVGVYPHVVAEAFPHAMPPVWLYVPFTGAQEFAHLRGHPRDLVWAEPREHRKRKNLLRRRLRPGKGTGPQLQASICFLKMNGRGVMNQGPASFGGQMAHHLRPVALGAHHK